MAFHKSSKAGMTKKQTNEVQKRRELGQDGRGRAAAGLPGPAREGQGRAITKDSRNSRDTGDITATKRDLFNKIETQIETQTSKGLY